MTTGNDNFDQGKDRIIAVSEISNSTACVTLGKRDPATHTFHAPEALKRQKNFESASQNIDGLNGDAFSDVKGDVALRTVKTAPTSANGSNNLNPVLDTQFNLPVEDSEIDPDEDSSTRKERR
jgi:hypothetical protein